MIRLIDLDSIKKNPNAGRSSHILAGQVTTKDWWDCGDKIVEKVRFGEEPGPDDIAISEESTGRPAKDPKIIKTEQKRDVQTVRTMEPEPEFLYKYTSLTVTCKSCKASFDFSKLESDSGCGPEDDWQSDTICPECHDMQCLEDDVVEETIDEALHRLSRIDPIRFKKLRQRAA